VNNRNHIRLARPILALPLLQWRGGSPSYSVFLGQYALNSDGVGFLKGIRQSSACRSAEQLIRCLRGAVQLQSL
jgi:hypothetical protein